MQTTIPAPSSSEQPGLSAPQPTNAIIHSPSTQNYVRRAKNILYNMGIVGLGRDHIEAIAEAALQSQQVFFAVAFFRPTDFDLNHFFDEFVRLCAYPVWLCRHSTTTILRVPPMESRNNINP
jgi:hypothetical protein